jgi:hypothetical protein
MYQSLQRQSRISYKFLVVRGLSSIDVDSVTLTPLTK